MPSRAEIVSFDNSLPHPGRDPWLPGAGPDTILVLADPGPDRLTVTSTPPSNACLGDRCEDRQVGIPPRTATDRALSRAGERLDIVFDVDLGELIDGHHVVARGITLGEAAALHYEFVPGLTGVRLHELGGFGWYWMLYATDDVGTEYSDNNGGAFDPESGGAATHGTRDIGGEIPPQARRLTIRFEPAEDWTPPEPWRRQIVVDLQLKQLAG